MPRAWSCGPLPGVSCIRTSALCSDRGLVLPSPLGVVHDWAQAPLIWRTGRAEGSVTVDESGGLPVAGGCCRVGVRGARLAMVPVRFRVGGFRLRRLVCVGASRFGVCWKCVLMDELISSGDRRVTYPGPCRLRQVSRGLRRDGQRCCRVAGGWVLIA